MLKSLFLAAALLVSPLTFADDIFDITNMYENVVPPVPTESGDKVEVVEMFWYGCPHCYQFEPHIQNWKASKPDNVKFTAVPAVFRKSWEMHARAFYAAEAMGKLDTFHRQFFKAIHEKRMRFKDRAALGEWVASIGLDADEFLSNFDSFAVAAKVQKAKKLTHQYKINGVPSIIVNGKYRSSGSLTGTYKNLIKVTNTLVAEESKAMNSSATGNGKP